MKVVASGISYRGKSNAVEYQWNSTTSAVTFINFESDGDISIYKDAAPLGTWLTFPISTRSATYASVDTTYVDNGKSTRHWNRDTCTFVQDSVMVIQGQSLMVALIRVTQRYQQHGDDYIGSDWFAPAIGFWVTSRLCRRSARPATRSRLVLA